MQQLVTRESLTKLLANEDRRGEVIGRALVVLLKRQTDAEGQNNTTNVNNTVGFSASDAKSGCITAKTFIKHKKLFPFQIQEWMEIQKGRPRILKYVRQLNQAANERVK